MQRILIALVAALALAAGSIGVHAAPAVPRAASVDVANKPIQFQAVRQDPINGQQTPLNVPLDALPASVRDALKTPVGQGLNSFWSKTAVPFLCDLAKNTLNGQGQSGFNLYGTECGFAPGGRATATTTDGGGVVLTFFLPQNFIKVWVTTPGTCADGHGTIFCPTDPHLSLTADVTLQATFETPGSVCDAHVDPFSAHVSNVKLDSQNLTADIAFDAASLWASLTGTDYVTTFENFIESGADQLNNNAGLIQQAITSQVAAFTSGLCNTIIPRLPGASTDLWMLNSSVDPNQGIVFQLLDEPPLPSLVPPTLSLSAPSVTAGNSVTVSGQAFPTNGPVALSLVGAGSTVPLGTATVNAGGFTTTLTVPAGTAAGNYTIHAEAPGARADAALQVLSPTAGSQLTVTYAGQALGPGDAISWETSGFALSGANFQPGQVSVYISAFDPFDENSQFLFSTTVAANGTFNHDLYITGAQVGGKNGYYNLQVVAGGTLVNETTVSVVAPEIIH
jgi:hypothetical protein